MVVVLFTAKVGERSGGTRDERAPGSVDVDDELQHLPKINFMAIEIGVPHHMTDAGSAFLLEDPVYRLSGLVISGDPVSVARVEIVQVIEVAEEFLA